MELSPDAFLQDEDREFFERELATFVPDRVFDAHAHFSHPETHKLEVPGLPTIVEYEEYMRFIDCLHPGRKVSALFLSFSEKREGVQLANDMVARAVAADSTCRGFFFITPEDDPEWVRDEVRRLGLHGLKCYHYYSGQNPTWDADISAFLPEPFVKLAHEEGWAITLHMVKQRSVTDPGNIHWIRHYCTNYPNTKLILAHCARAFQPAHGLEGLPQLADLGDLYFDSSANCAPHAHEAIIRIMGHKRLMYGADSLGASHIRGTTVPVADTFVWLSPDQPIWDANYGTIKPTLIGLESLRALKWACWSARLSDSQIEDIFWNNAADLFGLERERTREPHNGGTDTLCSRRQSHCG